MKSFISQLSWKKKLKYLGIGLLGLIAMSASGIMVLWFRPNNETIPARSKYSAIDITNLEKDRFQNPGEYLVKADYVSDHTVANVALAALNTIRGDDVLPSRLFIYFHDNRSASVRILSLNGGNSPGDSVKDSDCRFDLEKENGQWKVVWIGRRWRGYPGRDATLFGILNALLPDRIMSQFWSTTPCC